jgi:hypothetical protein
VIDAIQAMYTVPRFGPFDVSTAFERNVADCAMRTGASNAA